MQERSRYSVIIQDQAYVVTLPERGGCHTHGATYEQAARNAQEVLELLMNGEREVPTPHEFQYPGPSGFTYQFAAPPLGKPKRKVKNATA